MAKLVLAFLFFASSTSFACPNLEGYFNYPGAAYLSVEQSTGSNNITTYKVTIDDGTCAACHVDQYLKADGITKETQYGRAKDITRVWCETNRLRFRQTTEYYGNSGETVYTESINQDYRINQDNNLVVENIENDKPVSKTVLERFSF